MNQLTNTFKLLTDETRVRILMLLYKEDLCVCELGGILEVPQPRISKNLAKFRDLGVVTDERRDKFVFYSLKKDAGLLLDALSLIDAQIHLYPELTRDRNRLSEKETFLNQCQIITSL